MSIVVVESVLRGRIEGLSLGGIPIVHDNERESEPETGTWCRFKVLASQSEQFCFSKNRDSGVAEAWLYCPVRQGDSDVVSKAVVVADGFRTATVSGVRFLSPTIVPQGKSGRWWAVMVLIPWEYDSTISRTTVTGAATPDPAKKDLSEYQAVMRARMEAAFPATTVRYDNQPASEPESGLWVRMTFQITKSEQADINGTQKRYRTEGVVFFQVFDEIRKGDKAVSELARDIGNAFRSVSVPPVVLRAPTITNAPRSARWWQVNVSVPFYADRIA